MKQAAVNRSVVSNNPALSLHEQNPVLDSFPMFGILYGSKQELKCFAGREGRAEHPAAQNISANMLSGCSFFSHASDGKAISGSITSRTSSACSIERLGTSADERMDPTKTPLRSSSWTIMVLGFFHAYQ